MLRCLFTYYVFDPLSPDVSEGTVTANACLQNPLSLVPGNHVGVRSKVSDLGTPCVEWCWQQNTFKQACIKGTCCQFEEGLHLLTRSHLFASSLRTMWRGTAPPSESALPCPRGSQTLEPGQQHLHPGPGDISNTDHGYGKLQMGSGLLKPNTNFNHTHVMLIYQRLFARVQFWPIGKKWHSGNNPKAELCFMEWASTSTPYLGSINVPRSLGEFRETNQITAC